MRRPWACVEIRVWGATHTCVTTKTSNRYIEVTKVRYKLLGKCSTMIQEIAESIKMCEPVTGRVCSTFCLTFSWSVGELIIGYDVVLIQLTCAHLGIKFYNGKLFTFWNCLNDFT